MTQPTEVEARFGADGRVTVQSFTWQGRKQAVTGHGRQWEANGARHVLVMTAGERVIELVYEDGAWRVERVMPGHAAA